MEGEGVNRPRRRAVCWSGSCGSDLGGIGGVRPVRRLLRDCSQRQVVGNDPGAEGTGPMGSVIGTWDMAGPPRHWRLKTRAQRV